MQSQQIQLNGQLELKVEGMSVGGYDVAYNFDKQELKYTPLKTEKWISTYIITKDLAYAVNAAIVTGRPLLLKGEPGSGKTKLAQAVASLFFGEEAYKYYFEWHVKSKSKAREGGYVFDHVGRLRDATMTNDDQARTQAANPQNYITLGAMGNAFCARHPEGLKPILLIDEIDKGDIDFPNDLLLELDEMRFKINELPDTFIESPAGRRPLVFITSNDERELPPAFLRRCLYYQIPPFDKALLNNIAKVKLKEFYRELDIQNPQQISDPSMHTFVDTFSTLRDSAPGKPPSTSELLDWLKLLTYHQHFLKEDFDTLVKDKDLQSIALKLTA